MRLAGPVAGLTSARGETLEAAFLRLTGTTDIAVAATPAGTGTTAARPRR